jgi:hypothetical protein
MLSASTLRLIEHLGIVREHLQCKLQAIDELLGILKEEIGEETDSASNNKTVSSRRTSRKKEREAAKERARQWARTLKK